MGRRMKFVILAAAMAASAAAAAIAGQAPPRDPAGTIRARQASYKQMAAALKGMNDQLHSSSPSVPVFRQGSALIAGKAVQLLNWFPPGTGAEAGVRTRALPGVWSDRATFTRRGGALLAAARDLQAAARSGDIARIRAAFPAVGHACGACHDDFRAPE